MDKVSSIDWKISFVKFEVSANSDYQTSILLPLCSYFRQQIPEKFAPRIFETKDFDFVGTQCRVVICY